MRGPHCGQRVLLGHGSSLPKSVGCSAFGRTLTVLPTAQEGKRHPKNHRRTATPLQDLPTRQSCTGSRVEDRAATGTAGPCFTNRSIDEENQRPSRLEELVEPRIRGYGFDSCEKESSTDASRSAERGEGISTTEAKEPDGAAPFGSPRRAARKLSNER